jgi:arylsulfatase
MLKHFCLPVFLLILFLGCNSTKDEQPELTNSKQSPPNILLILADDMGFSDIGCYGSEISTPNLDKLAANGLKFTQFYNAARCCPTRASLLTGLYPHQVGMGGMVSSADKTRPVGPYQGYLRPDSCSTIAEALKPMGYGAYMSGKWHVGEAEAYWPEKRGFDKYWGLISGASSYYEIIRDQPRERVMVKDDQLWEPPANEFYMTDATTDYAIEQIDEHLNTNPDQPFFSYVAYTAPHWPLHALPEDIAKYKGKYDIGWDSLRQWRYERQSALQLFDKIPELAPRPSSIPAWESIDNKADWARRMEVYAAMVDRLDQQIGRLLQHLQQSGQLDNTMILFLSDNGGCAENISKRNLNDTTKLIGERGSYVAYREPWAYASNTPFRLYKSWVHEGGVATPFIMHYPNGNLPTGKIIHQATHIIDLMPTFLQLAKAKYTQENIALKGMDLLPLIHSQEPTDRLLFWEHSGNKAILNGDWKLVSKRDKNWELYNLQSDRSESLNMAESQPEKVEQLRKQWQEWANDVGVK